MIEPLMYAIAILGVGLLVCMVVGMVFDLLGINSGDEDFNDGDTVNEPETIIKREVEKELSQTKERKQDRIVFNDDIRRVDSVGYHRRNEENGLIKYYQVSDSYVQHLCFPGGVGQSVRFRYDKIIEYSVHAIESIETSVIDTDEFTETYTDIVEEYENESE